MRATVDRNPIDELLMVVNELTQTHQVRVADNHDRTLGFRDEHALLLLLRNARYSDFGGLGSGKPARERTPLEIGAVDTYDRIVGEVREWFGRETDYQELGAPAPEVTLRQWFIRFAGRFRQNLVTVAVVEKQLSMAEGWVQQIRDILDPPKKIEIKAPCPQCGKEWLQLSSDESVRVLWVIERDSLAESFAVCRGCNTPWVGVGRMRELRIALDDAEIARMEISA